MWHYIPNMVYCQGNSRSAPQFAFALHHTSRSSPCRSSSSPRRTPSSPGLPPRSLVPPYAAMPRPLGPSSMFPPACCIYVHTYIPTHSLLHTHSPSCTYTSPTTLHSFTYFPSPMLSPSAPVCLMHSGCGHTFPHRSHDWFNMFAGT